MRRLVPLDPIQSPPADFASLHRRVAVFRDVVARCRVVVDSCEALGQPRAEQLGEHPVGQNVPGRMDGDMVACRGGPEAEGSEN